MAQDGVAAAGDFQHAHTVRQRGARRHGHAGVRAQAVLGDRTGIVVEDAEEAGVGADHPATAGPGLQPLESVADLLVVARMGDGGDADGFGRADGDIGHGGRSLGRGHGWRIERPARAIGGGRDAIGGREGAGEGGDAGIAGAAGDAGMGNSPSTSSAAARWRRRRRTVSVTVSPIVAR